MNRSEQPIESITFASPTADQQGRPARRKIIAAIAVTLALGAVAVYWMASGRYQESTQDAYVRVGRDSPTNRQFAA